MCRDLLKDNRVVSVKTLEIYSQGHVACTYKICNGHDARNSIIKSAFLIQFMYAKFLKLGIPISSHFPFSCTEFRFSLVGELRSVRNDPTAARMIVPKTLITACKPVSSFFT